MTAQILLERSFDQAVKAGEPVQPWPSMDTQVIAQLNVPALGKSAVILSGASGQALAFAPAHLQQTAPLGAPGHSVIAAHKNTHFSFLQNVRMGDEVRVHTVSGKVVRYEVTGASIVHKDKFAAELDGPARLALVTCYPFDAISFGGPLRYVVIAREI